MVRNHSFLLMCRFLFSEPLRSNTVIFFQIAIFFSHGLNNFALDFHFLIRKIKEQGGNSRKKRK